MQLYIALFLVVVCFQRSETSHIQTSFPPPVHSIPLRHLARSCDAWASCPLSKDIGVNGLTDAELAKYINLHHYLTPITVNGVQLEVMVDTGVPYTIVFDCTRARLNSTPPWQGDCTPDLFPEIIGEASPRRCIVVTESHRHEFSCNRTTHALLAIPDHAEGKYPMFISDSLYLRTPLPPFWNNTGGTLGLGYSSDLTGKGFPFSDSYRSLFFGTLNADVLGVHSTPARVEPWFALDLNEDDAVSTMHLGGLNPPTGSSVLEWGEIQPLRKKRAHFFSVYDFSICGARLLANYSGNWLAQVDTASTCLALPSDFVDMLLKWAPGANCHPSAGSGPVEESRQLCYWPRAGQESDALPGITFRLREDGQLFTLPLHGLCVSRMPRRADVDMPFDRPYRIEEKQMLFGTQTLRYLYAAFDADKGRVGFAQKPGAVTSQASCPKRDECVGSQRYYEALNICVDPTCEEYYFHTVNQDSKTCKLSVTFEVIVVILLVIFSFTELFLTELYQRLVAVALPNAGSTVGRVSPTSTTGNHVSVVPVATVDDSGDSLDAGAGGNGPVDPY